VTFLERPSLAGNRQLCLADGKVWSALRAVARREQHFRDAMKMLTVRAGVVRFDVLSEVSLSGLVDECFASVAAGGGEQTLDDHTRLISECAEFTRSLRASDSRLLQNNRMTSVE
jgi:hypothetical protein